MEGTRLNHYEILAPLGRGGMGEVWAARDTRLDREVAVKILPADLVGNPERLSRFEREARAVAALDHPNIVTIHSIEEAETGTGKVRFLTMQRVHGRTLSELIPRGGLDLPRFFDLAVPLADAVAAAHARGIVHRDLKPANVMVTDEGRVMVLDFGLAKLAQPPATVPAPGEQPTEAATVAGPRHVTEEGRILGTAAYMSPEQAEGKRVDHRTDIFSLGILLYEMATGEPPFQGDSRLSILTSVVRDRPVPVSERKRELPRHLGRIVAHCLEKAPDRRFQSALDVRNELEALREEIQSGSLEVAPPAAASPPAVPSPAASPPASDPAASPPASDPAASAPAARPPSARPPSEPASGDGEAGSPAWAGGLGAAMAVAVVLAALAFLAAVVGRSYLSGASSSSPADAVRSDGSAGEAADGAVGAAGSETAGLADPRPSLAVLYFDNTSDADELQWLRAGLTEMLVTDLSQSGDVRVLSTDRLHRLLEEAGVADAPAAEAVPVVGRRGDIDRVLVGSYMQAGDRIRLNARLQAVDSGEILASEVLEGEGEESVFDLVDELTRRVRSRLTPAAASDVTVDRDVAEVTTSSVEAYRLYVEAERRITDGDDEGAVPLLERAVKIDPEFAMAYAKLSVAHGNMTDFAAERRYSTLALDHADHLTEPERLYVEARYFSGDPRTLEQAVAAYERLLELVPDDTAARNNLGLLYNELGRVDDAIAQYEILRDAGAEFVGTYGNLAGLYCDLGRFDEAVGVMEEYLERHPGNPSALQRLAETLFRAGRVEEAVAQARRAIEANPGDPGPGRYLFEAALLREDWEEAERLISSLDADEPFVRFIVLPFTSSALAGYVGDTGRMVEILTEAADAAPGGATGPGSFHGLTAAQTLLFRGEPEAALAEARDALALADGEPESSLVGWKLVALAQAELGRRAAAEATMEQARRLREQFPEAARLPSMELIQGRVALSLGDAGRAVELLEEAREGLRPRGYAPDSFHVEVWFDLARARLEMGDTDAAERWFRTVTERHAERIESPIPYVRSLWFLGRIHADRGEEAGAREYFRRFLDHWGDGDIDRDRVAEAERYLAGQG